MSIHADKLYGTIREEQVKEILEEKFKLKLTHSLYRYSEFDYYDIPRQKFIIEIKNYRNDFEKFPFVIIGVNKGLSNNGIFVFRHNDTRLHYIQFNKKLFKTFNTRYIQAYYRNVPVLCYDIPRELLIEIIPNDDKIYKIKFYKEEKKLIEQLILEDEEQSKGTFQTEEECIDRIINSIKRNEK